MTPERWQRIENLFHDARERPPADRAAFLAVACGDDRALHEEVQSLLDQQDSSVLRDGLAAAAALVMPSSRGHHGGTVLGPYVLGELLGTGAIGDVYRACDTKLGRDVAVKILPDTLGQHPARLARFEREARILAALNHPNIAAIYGVEETVGIRALVLELVDGVTLAEKLRSGETPHDTTALPLDEALGIATQIAEALEAAHRKGIVHRDLKPANVKITTSGVVKVLDFGLAKILVTESAEPAAISVLATNEGTVLGTVAYMSPEQARGQPVDKRTDIWAFGCVVYEMLAGCRPFPGSASADVLGAITAAEPDWTRLPPLTPRRVRDVLRRCLTKDPDRRLHDIADARIEIEDARSGDRASDLVDVAPAPRAGLLLVPRIAIGVAALVAAGAVWFAVSTLSRDVGAPARVSIALPPDVSLYAIGRGSSVTVSPDGQRIVYAGIVDGRTQLYTRLLEGFEHMPIAGTEGATNPFFSPDGRWLGFIVNGSLKKVPVEGGVVLPVTDVPAVQGATWAADDTIVFTSGSRKDLGLWRVASTGGTPQHLTTPRDGELNHSWPQMLAAGTHVLYTVWKNTGFEGGRVVVQSLEGGERRVLVERASYGRVIADAEGRAYLIYARPEGLLAAPFDRDRLDVSGPHIPVVESILTNLSGGAHYSVSPAGLLAYVPGTLNEIDKTLLWVDRNGTPSEIGTITGMSFQYRLAPDGRRIARPNAQGPERDIWVDDLARLGTSMRLTSGGLHNLPVWTPDGRRVIYSVGLLPENLFWRAADGAGAEERLTKSPNRQFAGSVSGDGSTVAYVEMEIGRPADIWLLPLHGSRQPRRLLSTPFAEANPRISPDGQLVAYQSNMSGQNDIYITSLGGSGRQIPVSKDGGFQPLWSPDGRELYYRNVETSQQGGRMMVVSIDTTGSEPKIGMPRVLFESPYQGEGDVAPDGRFLLLKPTRQDAESRVIQLVLNWFADLDAKVPAH